MKKVLVLVASLFLFSGIYAQQVSDPNVELRDAKNFHGIRLSSAFNVYLTQGTEEKVAVSAADRDELRYITVEVRNGILHIGWDRKGKWSRGDKKLKAYISYKQIDELSASGACNVSIVDLLKADVLKADLSGASDLKGKIDVRKVTFDLSGASDTRLSGKAAEMNIEASGASSFKGFDLVTEYCNASASGASSIRITVNKELSATASGASDIDYKGDGVIRNIKTSGASSVSRS